MIFALCGAVMSRAGRSDMMKSSVRSPAFRRKDVHVIQSVFGTPLPPEGGTTNIFSGRLMMTKKIARVASLSFTLSFLITFHGPIGEKRVLGHSPARASQSESATLSPQEIKLSVLPKVVTLVGKETGGQVFAIGSGFFVDHWTIVTNYYSVKEA